MKEEIILPTGPECPSNLRTAPPLLVSYKIVVLSDDPEANIFPSFEKHTLVTSF